MNNIEKKLDALIDALGFDVKSEYVPLNDSAISNWNDKWRNANTSHIPPKPEPTTNYKLTKKDNTPLDVTIKKILIISQLDPPLRFIKLPRDKFNSVVEWFIGMAIKSHNGMYVIFNVEVWLDE